MGSGIGKRALHSSLTALQRIEVLEKAKAEDAKRYNELVGSLNQALVLADQRLDTIEKCINALSEVVGNEKVADVLKQQLLERATKKAEAEKKAVEDAVASGQLVASDTVAENTLIVGREVGTDGVVKHPGWLRLFYGELSDEFKSVFLGKKVGDSIDVPNGTLEVLALYSTVDNYAKQAAVDAVKTANGIPVDSTESAVEAANAVTAEAEAIDVDAELRAYEESAKAEAPSPEVE